MPRKRVGENNESKKKHIEGELVLTKAFFITEKENETV